MACNVALYLLINNELLVYTLICKQKDGCPAIDFLVDYDTGLSRKENTKMKTRKRMLTG